jgi:hypothetical protein
MRFNQTEKLNSNHFTDYDSTIIEQSSSERNQPSAFKEGATNVSKKIGEHLFLRIV